MGVIFLFLKCELPKLGGKEKGRHTGWWMNKDGFLGKIQEGLEFFERREGRWPIEKKKKKKKTKISRLEFCPNFVLSSAFQP